jgi:site-specific DNA-methyltransferase (adenine-specific)
VEGKITGRPTIGIDLNPLAVAFSMAKLQPVSLDDVQYRISELAQAFPGISALADVPEDVRVIFHDRTLAQLCFLRGELDQKRAEDAFLTGTVLGILHGKHRQNGSTAYLSIDMPNTFSMSPNYVRQFVAEKGLLRPPVDVFGKLRERSQWLLRDGALNGSAPATVIRGDATRMAELLSRVNVASVGAIVTSPPYLGVLRYGAFNWIRLWFLGYSPSQIDGLLDGTDSLDSYLSFMTSVLKSGARVLRPDGILVMVIGDVVEKEQHVRLAHRVWDEIGGLVPFELMAIQRDGFDESSKTTRIWGEDKKGRATPVERYLVLRRTTKKTHRVLTAGRSNRSPPDRGRKTRRAR